MPSAKAPSTARKPQHKSAKTGPKPPRPASVKISLLERTLASQVETGHLPNALRTVDRLLALSVSTPAYTHSKLALLLHLGRPQDALSLLAEDDGNSLEKAYALYKVGKDVEARHALEGVKGEGAQVLEAQLAQRSNDYALASDLYSSVASHFPESHPLSSQLSSSLTLAQSHAEFLTSSYLDHLRQAEDTLDLDELEETVPPLPPRKAIATEQPVASGSKPVEPEPVAGAAGAGKGVGSEGKKKKKRTHRLPKGAVEGEPFEEDPERWLPLKARTSTLNNPSSSSSSTKTGKKGGKKPEGMTAGFTQGSVSMLPQSSASAGGSGGKKKKGRK